VLAVKKGAVIMKKWQSCYGNTIVIDHGNGIYSRYAHLADFDPDLGSTVSQGGRLGTAGATSSCGNIPVHLHFAMYSVADNTASAHKPEILGTLYNFPVGVANVDFISNGSTLLCKNYCGKIKTNLVKHDLRLFSLIDVNPYPIAQDSATTIRAEVANYGRSTFLGRISAAIYTMNGTLVSNSTSQKVYLRPNYKYNYTIQRTFPQIPPGTYSLTIEYTSDDVTQLKVPAGNYQNPVTIQVVNGTTNPTSGCSHSEYVTGISLINGCSDCVTTVCRMDPQCCSDSWDSLCVNEANEYCSFANEEGGNPDLNNGHFDFCSQSYPCNAGQGDCDNNSECKDGLTCIHNIGTDYGFSPSIDVCDY